MEVILLADVEKVGLRGEVVDVARGYARNFLLPRRLAETATPAKVAELQRRGDRRARQEASTFEQARELGTRLEAAELRFDVKAGPTGSLFGSVTATDLADEIWRVAKIRVDRRRIALGEPIKKVGRYAVPIELFTDVTVDVQTLVVPEGGELPEVSDTEGSSAEASSSEVSDTVEPEAPEAVEPDAALAEEPEA
ncbi:MAG TPA: 50S ribosomal protein L9 [Gaiellaceae bacterium]|nr:50S ribosomal protein L9 [Gaiellaceae bacterium]